MKVAITGHTSGIGRELYKHFDNVVGFSRSNGYDITKDLDKIIEESKNADIFINNAYSGFMQTELLFKLFHLWKDQDKLIVNISSNSGDGIKPKVHPYSIHKAALDKACEQLSHQKVKCKVINIRPGWVDTPMVEVVKATKMDPIELAELIVFLMKSRSYICREITIVPS